MHALGHPLAGPLIVGLGVAAALLLRSDPALAGGLALLGAGLAFVVRPRG